MKHIIFPVVILSAVLLLLSACGSQTDVAEPTEPEPNVLIAEGSLLPVSALDMSFSVTGQVAEVLVNDGDTIRPGQVLARLNDSADAQAALEGALKDALAAQQALDDYIASADVNLAQGQIEAILAEKRYSTARNNYFSGKSREAKARMDEAAGNQKIAEDALKQLEENEGLDPDQVNTLEAQRDTANANVASSQAAIDALDLEATMRGMVADVNIIAGQRVAAGETVMAVADFSEWIIETDNLTEVEVVNISVGQEVDIALDALPDVVLKGKVANINERFEEKRGDVTYTVTIVLSETHPLMRWGMTAAVRFTL